MDSSSQQSGGIVNRIPPSTMKRGCTSTSSSSKVNSDVNGPDGYNYNEYSATKQHDPKRQKMEWDIEPFPKLNPIENTIHAQRITTRYKAILKGKNTIGYNLYCEQIPKHLRRLRSMDTPNTPDHTLDIPSKRWQGLVKAWRVALHKYDPPDLVSTTCTSTTTKYEDEDDVTAGIITSAAALRTNSVTTPERITRCVSTAKKNHHNPSTISSPSMEETTPISMTEACSTTSPCFFDPMCTTTTSSRRNLDFDALNDDDSDDDLI